MSPSPELSLADRNLRTAESSLDQSSLSMELFDTPGSRAEAGSNQLMGLPGYRRSTIHPHSDDWKRVAELQARNKACPPHLRTSYSLESEYVAFVISDDELRNGDPSNTVRRASALLGQLRDSVASHRHSLMLGQTAKSAKSGSLSQELLTEQIQILQGKVSCLEEEMRKATEAKVGENMGPVMEREMLESEINSWRTDLESTIGSLEEAEIQAKTQQLTEYQQEMTLQKELLEQLKSHTEEVIQAEDEILDNLQKEIREKSSSKRSQASTGAGSAAEN